MSYTFVCIGTNKIVPDSFGPRVGDKLKQVFYSSPDATYFLEELENKKQIILIDSAIGKREDIGNTYVNRGGMEIGKAFNQSIYFPANINIKTIIGAKEYMPNYSVNQIENLANEVASKIIKIVFELPV